MLVDYIFLLYMLSFYGTMIGYVLDKLKWSIKFMEYLYCQCYFLCHDYYCVLNCYFFQGRLLNKNASKNEESLQIHQKRAVFWKCFFHQQLNRTTWEAEERAILTARL